jgi:hypothetical protein
VRSIRIGAGAGYAGDRWEPALELIESCALDYIVFECLAERTIALGQLERLAAPDRGYNPWLEDRWRAILPLAAARGVRIVTNMGAANPRAAARLTVGLIRDLGLPALRVAVVSGDDVLEEVRRRPDLRMMEDGRPVGALGSTLIAANAYLGAEPVAQALTEGADIVITGRTGDPSLFLGCMMHGLGWRADDWPRMADGTVIGHLLECAGQVTGGYFADPGVKDVQGLDRLGFPYADVRQDGVASISKPPFSGGRVTVETCKEQLLYECGDPARYITPDCVADFTGVRIRQVSEDRVAISGASATPRTETLKVTVCHRAGYVGEGHVAYAGPNVHERAEMAAAIVRSRVALRGLVLEDLRIDLIGMNALHGTASGPGQPYEVRVRVAGRSSNRRHAAYLAQEVQTLLTNGPYGGGGDFMQVRDVIGVSSVLLPRDAVHASIEFVT